MEKGLKGLLMILMMLIILCIISIIDACGQTEISNNTNNGVITGDALVPEKGFELTNDLIIEGDLFLNGNLNIKSATLVVKGVIKNTNSGYKISIQTNDGIIVVFGFVDEHAKTQEEATDFDGDFIVYKQNGKDETNKPENAYIEKSKRYNSPDALKIAEELLEEKAQFLPIELVYFRAIQNNEGIKLYWETASETNNDYFTIEYSYDGINFYAAGVIDGAGTSSMVNDYSFIWEHEKSALMYFRLKQTDYNGEYSYSDVIVINYNKENKGVYFQNGKIMYSGRKLRI